MALARVHRDGARDRFVEASVERAEVISADRRVRFERQFGDGLTDITIVVNDLRHRETLEQEIVAVLAGALVYVRAARSGSVAGTQGVDQLIQKDWDTVVDLGLARWRNRPRGDFCSTTLDNFIAVESDEFMQHIGLPLVAQYRGQERVVDCQGTVVVDEPDDSVFIPHCRSHGRGRVPAHGREWLRSQP